MWDYSDIDNTFNIILYTEQKGKFLLGTLDWKSDKTNAVQNIESKQYCLIKENKIHSERLAYQNLYSVFNRAKELFWSWSVFKITKHITNIYPNILNVLQAWLLS